MSVYLGLPHKALLWPFHTTPLEPSWSYPRETLPNVVMLIRLLFLTFDKLEQ